LAKDSEITVEDIETEGEEHTHTPELRLWLAVIERAMLDLTTDVITISREDRRDLNWFFFEQEPKPYNLAYICQNFLDHHHAVTQIRKRIKHLQKEHVILYKRKTRHGGF
jgi:hypothetical protein